MSDEALFEKLNEMTNQLTELDAKLADPAMASDHEQLATLGTRRAALEPIVQLYRDYRAAADEASHLREMIESEEDGELKEMARTELPDVERRAADLLERIKSELVTADDRAVGAVILEIRAGVGGDEAAIWAGDLLEMYQRYAAQHRWKMEMMSFSPAEMGGYREVILELRGSGAWRHLGYEGGGHCVKRVPETESQGRIHTSTATVAVLPEPEKVEVRIDPNDVEEHITTAQGPGGQNVNKVATAVKLRHIPTGVEVRMQDTKSQHQNREKAWQLLRARLFEQQQQDADAERGAARRKMIGTAERGERIRTYRFKDNLCVDHRLGESFNLQAIMAGNLDEMVAALMEREKAERLAAL